jgi:signal transduction histidine kinase
MGSKPNMIGMLNQQASYYFNKKDYQLSKDFFLKSKQLLKAVDSDVYKCNIWSGLCKTNFALGEIDSARYYGNEALKLAEQTQLLSTHSDIAKSLYNISKTKNNAQKALEYLETHIKLKDSLFNQDKSKALGRLEAELEFKNLKEKLELERQTEKRENELKLETRKKLIFALIGIVLTLLAISALLYFIKQQKTRVNNRLRIISDELHEKNEKLKKLHVQKNRLISIISHDFRGPLNNLSQSIDLYLDKNLSVEEFNEWLPLIKSNIESTQGLIENLIVWAKQSLKEFQINKEVLNLYDQTFVLLQTHEVAIHEKDIKVSNQIPKDAEIFIDKNTLDLVMRNLLVNSLKYCNANDEISFSFSQDNTFTKVCIEDTGVGMKKKTAEALFQSDDLISALGTGKEKGSGIGAILSKNFLEENGGTIWVDYSQEGKGTRICFQVPVKPKK